MTNSPGYPFYVGAQGWDHEEWVGVFYPEDLPADWRLAYYHQFFTCCYLDYGTWAQQPEAALIQWLEDLMSHFRLVIETPARLSTADRGRLSILAPRTGLVGTKEVLQAACLWLPKDPDWRVLTDQIQRRTPMPEMPCYLISQTGSVADLQQAVTLLEILGY